NFGGNLFVSELAKRQNAPFLNVGFGDRAAYGNVFYFIPGGSPADYGDLLRANGVDPNGARFYGNRFYVGQEALEKASFEPGIYSDISFVTLIGVKLALDLLNRDAPNFTPRLIDRFTQYAWICNTDKPEIGGPAVGAFRHPLEIRLDARDLRAARREGE
ncbi:MAG: hypothetical protein HUK22_04050, partial [Thermoguttaceae bacterium]|nr:hypothetical protein [Thermoguttaceae bacterium]